MLLPGKLTLVAGVMTLLLTAIFGHPQATITVPKSSFGLEVIDNEDIYKKTIFYDSCKSMINLRKIIPALLIDLKYAGKQNFTGQQIYPRGTHDTYLRLPAANALLSVQNELFTKGLGLNIFDAYRPYSATVKFWEIVKDERYVADPKKGSGHNRGIAVDLTLVDLASGREIDLGTGFDNFTDTAHHGFRYLPQNILRNRQLLRSVMEKYGFKSLETEWWHYSWPGADKYEILDLDISKGKKYFGN